MTPELTFDIKADALAAVWIAKSKEETRYYLNGVYITPWISDGVPGVMIVATDGYMLACYFDATGSASRPAIISGDFSATSLRTKAGERAPRRLECSGDIGRVKATPKRSNSPKPVALCLVAEIPGVFPAWEQIVPKAEVGEFGGRLFSWSHIVLSRVCQVSERLNGSREKAMDAFQKNKDAPAFFTFGSGCPLMVVAMPMRGGDATVSVATLNAAAEPLGSVDNRDTELLAAE